MREVEPNGESLQAFKASLFDLMDARFEQDFIDNPGLNEVANRRATLLSNETLLSLKEQGITISARELARIHLATKKVIFLFNDPRDIGDTVSDSDFVDWYAGTIMAEDNIASAANALDCCASLLRVYKIQSEELAGSEEWAKMSQSQRFGFSCEVAYANIPHDFTD